MPGGTSSDDDDEHAPAGRSAGRSGGRGTGAPDRASSHGRAAGARRAGGAHARALRIWMRLPNMTTPIRIDALGDDREVRVDVQEGHVGADQLEDDDGDDRAEDAAAAAREADAAEDDGGDAEQRVAGPGPASRCPCSPSAQSPPRAANRPGQRRRRGSSSGRPRRRSGTPPAGCCRWRRCDRPSRDRRSGIQIDGDDDDQDDARPWGSTRCRSGPTTRSLSQCAAPPPGRLEDEERAAGPHERHRQRDDDVGHPGDDDEAAVDRAEHDAQQEHADHDRDRRTPRSGPSSAIAETTLVRAIIEPIERSMPPRDDDDRLGRPRPARAAATEMARPWMPVGAVVGWMTW